MKTLKIEENKDISCAADGVLEGMLDGDVQADLAGLSARDIAIPFLRILQDLSPQVKSGPTKLEGAEAGMLFNTTTEQLFHKALFVPCAMKKTYVEWILRTEGGGFVAAHEDETVFGTATRVATAWMLPNGHEIIPTMMHYGLVYGNGGVPQPVVIPFNRTQLKKSRQWIANMSLQIVRTADGEVRRPRIYSYAYKIGSVLESKDNYTWFGWNVGKTPVLLDNALIFNMAKNFASLITEGKVSVKFDDVMENGDDVIYNKDSNVL